MLLNILSQALQVLLVLVLGLHLLSSGGRLVGLFCLQVVGVGKIGEVGQLVQRVAVVGGVDRLVLGEPILSLSLNSVYLPLQSIPFFGILNVTNLKLP